VTEIVRFAESHKKISSLFSFVLPFLFEFQNRVIQRGLNIALEVFHSSQRGWGVRTKERLERGRFICCYVGEWLDTEETRRRQREIYDARQRNYVFTLREFFGQRVIRTNIDATDVGNVSKLFNHSCDPNLTPMAVRVESFVPNIAFFTNRVIEVDEELTFDYGEGSSEETTTTMTTASTTSSTTTSSTTTSSTPLVRFECRCGSRNCRRFLPFDPTA
jgi:histone-lysine N-methyltransferase SUV39H